VNKYKRIRIAFTQF